MSSAPVSGSAKASPDIRLISNRFAGSIGDLDKLLGRGADRDQIERENTLRLLPRLTGVS